MGAAPGTADRRRILIVDDIELNRVLTEALLRGATYEVHSVGDGNAALAALETQSYDLVLMDIDMPGLNGHETAAAIRRRDSAPAKLVALSASGDALSRFRSQEVGMSAHIARPIPPRDFLQQIEHMFWSAPALPRPDPWDHHLYQEWVERLGAERMQVFLLKLRDQLRELRTLLTEPVASSRDALHRMAHDVSSTGGMLGFMDVTRNCRTLLEAQTSTSEAQARPILGEALERAIARLDQHLSADNPRAFAA